MDLPLQLLLGVVLSTAIGYAGYRRRALTRSGVIGALLTGTAIFGFGGLGAGLLLIAFFGSSSLLTHYKESAKTEAAEAFAKGGPRDLGQALANGGVAAVMAVAYGATGEQLFIAGLVGALA